MVVGCGFRGGWKIVGEGMLNSCMQGFDGEHMDATLATLERAGDSAARDGEPFTTASQCPLEPDEAAVQSDTPPPSKSVCELPDHVVLAWSA